MNENKIIKKDKIFENIKNFQILFLPLIVLKQKKFNSFNNKI